VDCGYGNLPELLFAHRHYYYLAWDPASAQLHVEVKEHHRAPCLVTAIITVFSMVRRYKDIIA